MNNSQSTWSEDWRENRQYLQELVAAVLWQQLLRLLTNYKKVLLLLLYVTVEIGTYLQDFLLMPSQSYDDVQRI